MISSPKFNLYCYEMNKFVEKVGKRMGSKYLDIALAAFMGFFAYTRFTSEQYGFAILFTVLCLLNLLTAFLKHKRMHDKMKDK